MTICPFMGVENSSAQGYFMTHLKAIRKDIECMFGILKKRWQTLNNGFYYWEVLMCENIFGMAKKQ